MKKFMFVSVLAVAAVSVSFGQAKPAPKTPTSVKCAVMTSESVNIAKATKEKMFSDYKGRRYFFCCGGCPGAFKADPAKFAKGPSIPTPKAPKKKV